MRKLRLQFIIMFLLVWLMIPSTTIAHFKEQPAVQAVLLLSPACFHCHHVITEVLVPMVERYGDRLQIMAIDASQPAGGELYQAAIKRYQIPQERQGVPMLVVRDIVLVGGQEIPEQFPGLVEEGLATGGIGWPHIPGLDQLIAALNPFMPSTPDDAAPMYLAYFFDSTCLECAQVGADLKELQTQYPNLVVREFNLRQEAALNDAMCEKYGLPDEYRLMAPTIFIGLKFVSPDEITVDRLRPLIEAPDTADCPPPWEGLEISQTAAATERIVERFKQFGVLAAVSAGLLDGANPCAFTTIIFFVSYLALVGRKGREILLVGAAFTLAVFLTYLAMGLGLAEVMRRVGSFALIARIIYAVTAIVCLALAVASVADYVKIRQGRLKEISLQLPKMLKNRIRKTIRTRSRMNGYVGAAFVAGVLVSVFELACTGQVYLPTIVFVTSVADLRLTAIVYLALYNLMFVVPLVAVFLVTYLGTSSRQVTEMFQAYAGAVKLFTASLFAILGLWLGYMILLA